MSDQPPTDPNSGSNAPNFSDPGPVTASSPAKKPAGGTGWKAWAVAGVVTAAVIGGGITLMQNGSKNGGATPVAAVAATATDGTSSQAQTSQQGRGAPGGRGTFGTITEIAGTTLTLDSQSLDGTSSTLTVKTDADTKFTETAEGTSADLAKGDHVVAIGEATSDGIAAQRITDSGDIANAIPRTGENGTPPGGQDEQPPADAGIPNRGLGNGSTPTVGTITDIGEGAITVTAEDGTITKVTISGETAISVTSEITIADLAKGDTVSAQGTVDGSTVTAVTVRKGGAGPGRQPGGFGRGGQDGRTRNGSDGASGSSTSTTQGA